eukprot:10143245-Prorocentrum_lima.AAC.1
MQKTKQQLGATTAAGIIAEIEALDGAEAPNTSPTNVPLRHQLKRQLKLDTLNIRGLVLKP